MLKGVSSGQCLSRTRSRSRQKTNNGRIDMKKLLTMVAALAALAAFPTDSFAQQGGGGGGGGGRGNFDPEQMRQRMMERYKEMLEVKTDDEWKVIEGRIQKV